MAILSNLSSINQKISKNNNDDSTATLSPINEDECLYKVLDKINVEFIDDFFKGTLIFEFDENNPSDLIYYIFAKSSKQIILYLKGGQFSDSLIIDNQEPFLANTSNANIKNFSSYSDLESKIPEAYNQCIKHQEFSDTIGLFFSFDRILNEVINDRKYNRISGFEANRTNSLNSTKELARALKFIPNSSSPPYSFISLFNHIIREKIINLNNFRIPYKKEYPVSEIENSHPNLANGKDLALYLHKLRNGNREEKTTFKEIDNLFSSIAEAHLDLRYQFLSKNQNYNNYNQHMPLPYSPLVPVDNNKTENSNNNLKDKVKFTITVTKEKGNIEIPLEYSGAGIQELVLLISLLKMPSSEGCIILLDEPAANLHPIMQIKLLNEFKNIINGKEQTEQNINKNQIFIISHSSHFIPKEKILSKSVKRIYLNDSSYSAISSAIKDENVENITSMSRMTNFTDNLILSLFASSVILCEGDNDYLAMPIWFEKYKEGDSLHDYNIMLFPLDGWNNIKYARNFLESFNIPYVALLDPDTMLNGNKSIFGILGRETPDLSNKDAIIKAIEELKKRDFIFIYGDNEDFVSSNGETFRNIISSNLSIGFEKLNRKHKNAGDISKNAREKYGDDKNKAFSISFAEETNPPEEIKALFDKALELAGAERYAL